MIGPFLCSVLSVALFESKLHLSSLAERGLAERPGQIGWQSSHQPLKLSKSKSQIVHLDRAASDYMHGLEDKKLEGSPVEWGRWLMARWM